MLLTAQIVGSGSDFKTSVLSKSGPIAAYLDALCLNIHLMFRDIVSDNGDRPRLPTRETCSDDGCKFF